MSLDEPFSINSVNKEEVEKSKYDDGIGMSIEYVRALIAKENEVIIDKDDPILLMVTILNAFFHEHEKVQEKYMIALKNLYSDQVNDFVETIQESTDKVEEKLRAISTEGLIKIYESQNKRMAELQAQLRNTCIIIGLLVLLNIAVMVWS